MNRLDFLTEWFYKENDRQTSLNDSLDIPIGILSGLLVLYFYMYTSFSFQSESNWSIEIFFIITLILSLLCWIAVVFLLFKSYNNLFKGYEYKGLPYPKVLNEQYDKLKIYIEQNKNALEPNIDINSVYDQQFIEMFSDYLNRNINNNDRKSWFLHFAKVFLLVCTFSTMLCSMAFIIHISSNKENNTIKKEKIENECRTIKLNSLETSLKIENYGRNRKKSTTPDA